MITKFRVISSSAFFRVFRSFHTLLRQCSWETFGVCTKDKMELPQVISLALAKAGCVLHLEPARKVVRREASSHEACQEGSAEGGKLTRSLPGR